MRYVTSLLLSLALLLGFATAAASAEDAPGSIRIEQRGQDGSAAIGGCYEVTHAGDDAGTFCDRWSGPEDGVVTIADLPPGTYTLRETEAPAAYRVNPDAFSVTVTSGDTVTRTRTHVPSPRLNIVTTDKAGAAMGGSCWMVKVNVDDEGFYDECDTDGDGKTTFIDLPPGDYVLLHITAPQGIDRIDQSAFAMPDEDKTLTFALEPAVKPANTVKPAVTGTATAGATLTGTDGTWTGTPELEFSRGWERCDADGTGCLAADDYDATYDVTAGDAGKALRFRVSVSNDGGRTTAYSDPVVVGDLAAPVNTVRPTVTGATEVGQKLTAAPGTWTNDPAFTYQWERCETAGGCADIPKATGATFKTTTAYAGALMRVVVTAKNGAGSASATSEPTAPLTDDPYAQQRPSVSGTSEVGETLTAYPGHWISHYGNLQFGYRWLRCDAADTTDCMAVGYGDTYVVTRLDEGHRLQVEVTATDAGGLGRARSNLQRVVPVLEPVNVEKPAITGKLVLGETIQNHVGRWKSDTTPLYLYSGWERCNEFGGACVSIPSNADWDDHEIVREDAGHTLRLVIHAVNPKGETYAYSDPTAVIALHPPVNTELPAITGKLVLGETIQNHVGRWKSDTTPLYLYSSWERCNELGGACVSIPSNADWDDHEIVRDDIGHTLRLVIRAVSVEGETYAYSAPTAVIEIHAPVNTELPAITGKLVLGETIQNHIGRWKSDTTLHVYSSWERCDATGGECVSIPSNADWDDHLITTDDIGHTLRLVIHAQSIEGDTYAYSAVTPVLAVHPPVNTERPAISGKVAVGQTIQNHIGRWQSDTLLHVYSSWERCDANGAACVSIPSNADWEDHLITADDLGHTLRLVIHAQSIEGDTYAYSDPTKVVQA